MNIFKKEVIKLRDPTPQEIMKYLGLPSIDFNKVDDEGKPPHFLPLDPDERKNFIADMEVIYQSPRMKKVVEYVINLLGNNSFQVADESKMPQGRYAAVGIRILMKQFEEAHNEYQDMKHKDEPSDEHEIL